MIHKQKIITMTKLAIYDKQDGIADRKADAYFRHDYIYRQNIGNRIAAFFGSIILLAIYWLQMIFIADLDIFAADLQKHIIDSVLFVLAVMTFYTVVGTIQSTRRYYRSQKRLRRYTSLLQQLERINERAKREEASDTRYGATANHKRNHY